MYIDYTNQLTTRVVPVQLRMRSCTSGLFATLNTHNIKFSRSEQTQLTEMKVLLLFSLVLVPAAFAGEYSDDNSVLVLTDDNLAEAIDEFQYILVEFCEYFASGRGNAFSSYFMFRREIPVVGTMNTLCRGRYIVNKLVYATIQVSTAKVYFCNCTNLSGKSLNNTQSGNIHDICRYEIDMRLIR